MRPDQSGQYIIRPQISEDDGMFLAKVEAWFKEAAEALRPAFFEEPKRLLRQSEWRAAVVSSYTLLEHHLRKYLTDQVEPDFGRQVLSIRPLLKILIKVQAPVDEGALKVVSNNINVRNQLVHTADDIDPQSAKKIVNAVFTLVDSLQTSDK